LRLFRGISIGVADKKIFFMSKYSLIIVFALASFSARAQMSDRLSEHPAAKSGMSRKAPSEAAAVSLTREMTNRLHLNEGQFLKLLPLNRTKLAGMYSIDQQYRTDESTRAAKAAELEAQFEQECSRILTPSQLSQLQQQNGQPNAMPANTGNGLG
jgi:Spy/CpxP family protein refolding chaperone